MTLDEEIRDAHDADRKRANALLAYLVDLPPKREAIRVITYLFEMARMDGMNHPAVAREMERRRAAVRAETAQPQPQDVS